MRRLLGSMATLACAAALLSGCGGDDGAGGPLESALSYMPKGTPFVVSIDTDLEGDQYRSVQDILDRFPGGLRLESLLRDQLGGGAGGVSFDKDVKPLLGNPFVVSATDVTSFVDDSEDDDFVAAIQVEDTEALDRIIDKTNSDEQGEVAGATVYEDDGTTFAVEDDMVVFAGSRRLLESALERADGDDHFDAGAFEDSLDGLPEEALTRIHLDLQALIADDPDTQAAREVEWVGALTTLGMTAAVEDDSVNVDFNLRADGEGLSDDDLPLAAGDEAPAVIRREGELGFGLRDPSQVVAFFEAALQAVEPQSFGEYETAKRTISQSLGVDLDQDLFAQLNGDLSVSVAVDGSFGARAEVEDPAAFARTVDKVAEGLPELGSSLGVIGVRARGELYEARLSDGGRFVFGVRNDVFVAASTAERALEVSTREPEAVEGAEGSLVMAADAEQVALAVLEQLQSQLGATGLFGGLFARPLDALTGSVTSSTDGMRGRLSLSLD
jgi:Protein of unknown function (DUF3352)